MSSGRTDTVISNGAEDIWGSKFISHLGAVVLSEDTIVGQALRLPRVATDAVALQIREARSEDVKSSHQFLTRLHRLRRIHPAQHFFPPFSIHCCELAHELVSRFPF